ncbi:XRE family transcriptional regulator [Ruminococcus sp. AF31-16BH]|jgi:transcriptional regulator with XRE-family HTH domain|nr:XRE family transcriptional regulator [Ruminococcus sp. AF31-16BH]RHQ96309.1 XRE family transcriptional regulator [Ruminococcus sp. AF21-3]RHS66292.1 XRE family transcriptional regulator [Ruminococcus sp. AM46-18]
MIMADNPYGMDPIDINDKMAARRIGKRIQKIRVERGISRAELGEKVGLTADRIQKYENGARKPKNDMVKTIAAALGVNSLALTDPIMTNYIGAMYALFELEDCYKMKVEKSGEDEIPAIRLTVGFQSPLYGYVKEWYETYAQIMSQLEVVSSDAEREEVMKAYHNWEWTYPQGIIDRDLLRRKIEELQDVYDKLGDGSSDD